MRNYAIESDFVLNKTITPLLYKQYDNGDTLEVQLYNDSAKITLTTETVLAFFQLTDGTIIQRPCTISAEGNPVVTLNKNVLCYDKQVECEFVIYYEDRKETTTKTILIDVQTSIDRVGGITADPSYDIIQQILALKYGDSTIVNAINNLNADIDEQNTKLSGIRTYIDTNLPALESNNTEAVTNTAALKKENDRADINIPALKAENNKADLLKSNLDGLDSANTLAASNISSLATQNTNAASNITDLTSKNATATTNISNLDTENVRAENNIAAMQGFGDVTQLAQTVQAVKSEVETARGIETNLDARLDKFDSSLANISNPNLLINGDFQVCQRDITNFSGGYHFDRWRSGNIIKPSKENNTLKLTLIANTSGYVWQTQTLEDIDFSKLLGKTLTVSARIKKSRADLPLRLTSFSKSAIALNTTDWQIVSRTFSLETNSTNKNIELVSDLGLILNDFINIDWIKLELGSIATPFVPRSYGEELALCQRYYQKINTLVLGYAHGTTQVRTTIPFITEMRIAPTPSVSALPIFNNGVANIATTSFSTRSMGVDSWCMMLEASNLTQGNVGLVQFETTSYITLDAEIY